MSKRILPALFACALIVACGEKNENAGEHDTTETVRDTTPVSVNDTTKFKFDFAIANIPSPANSMQELSGWGVPYDAALMNDHSKVSGYTTEYQKSVNLGVYCIDMAYAMMNEKGPDVLDCMKNVMRLGDDLGLRNSVSAMVGKRAEMNLNNRDSLFHILEDIFVKSDTYLRTNERVYTAASVFTGSWIESLYLTGKIAERVTDPAKKEIAKKHLWEQRFYLGNLIGLMNDYRDKKDCSELLADLKPIHEEIMAIKQPSEMSDEKFKSISGKLIKLREKLVM
jgi:hypothetical protein